MDGGRLRRTITVGRAPRGWFTRTDDGQVAWHPSRHSAVETAREWVHRHRPAEAFLHLAEEVALLFSAL